MIIYLVRHGDSEKKSGLSDRDKLEAGLSSFGRLEARAAGEALKKLGVEKIISSPFSRAVETAEIIARECNLKLTLDEKLREFFADLDVKDPDLKKKLKADARATPDAVFAGGESFNSAVGRLETFIAEAARLPFEKIAVVAHRVIVEGMLAKEFGIRTKDHEWLPTASVTALEISPDGGKKILFVGRRYRNLPLLLETLKRKLRFAFKRQIKE